MKKQRQRCTIGADKKTAAAEYRVDVLCPLQTPRSSCVRFFLIVRMAKRLLTVVGIDVEHTGRVILSVGVGSIDETGTYSMRNFNMHGVIVPHDDRGPLITTDGVVRDPVGKVEYNAFSKDKWDTFWSKNPKQLIAQLRPTTSAADVTAANDEVWRDLRVHVDNLTRIAHSRGARVRIASDNPSVDLGRVNEHLRRIFYDSTQEDGHGDEGVTLDYLLAAPESGGKPASPTRVHTFVVDTRGPRWLRKLGILKYSPMRAHGMKLRKHVASHDALLAACEYAAFVRDYPAVDS
jgi:hypothetical protein